MPTKKKAKPASKKLAKTELAAATVVTLAWFLSSGGVAVLLFLLAICAWIWFIMAQHYAAASKN